ncbi:hypothetical protein M422DRAFT_54333 [Sphaerobolus stellatus SS14]|uniref:Uncharacterized protein n=1 Tax=Sphaerobolus stellatus (strain SS14) TaxID=990650 RepID=A0A0C9UUU8_SPHS4|nr:hypothetical protein M422DRAFT_54333 [Sphaerobolus stellatus SS14]
MAQNARNTKPRAKRNTPVPTSSPSTIILSAPVRSQQSLSVSPIYHSNNNSSTWTPTMVAEFWESSSGSPILPHNISQSIEPLSPSSVTGPRTSWHERWSSSETISWKDLSLRVMGLDTEEHLDGEEIVAEDPWSHIPPPVTFRTITLGQCRKINPQIPTIPSFFNLLGIERQSPSPSSCSSSDSYAPSSFETDEDDTSSTSSYTMWNQQYEQATDDIWRASEGFTFHLALIRLYTTFLEAANTSPSTFTKAYLSTMEQQRAYQCVQDQLRILAYEAIDNCQFYSEPSRTNDVYPMRKYCQPQGRECDELEERCLHEDHFIDDVCEVYQEAYTLYHTISKKIQFMEEALRTGDFVSRYYGPDKDFFIDV